MKKTATILLLFISSLFADNAFSQAFDDGTNVVSLGFGLPPSRRITNDFDIYKQQRFSDFKLSNYGTGVLKFEHGLHKYFGLGLNFEYSASRVTYKYALPATPEEYEFTGEVRNKILGGFARFNGHFPVSDKIDIYGGAGLGYLYTINKIQNTNPIVSFTENKTEKILDFDYQITVGVRFMIKENIGMFFEVGRATTICQLGIAFKF